jgi:hypothetical protein
MNIVLIFPPVSAEMSAIRFSKQPLRTCEDAASVPAGLEPTAGGISRENSRFSIWGCQQNCQQPAVKRLVSLAEHLAGLLCRNLRKCLLNRVLEGQVLPLEPICKMLTVSYFLQSAGRKTSHGQ